MGGSPGLVVMGGGSCSKGSNPGAVYWMDMIFFAMVCYKNCNRFVWKDRK